MATIAQTSRNQIGAVTVTTTASTASDTFAYAAGTGQLLVIRNNTAGSLNVTIDGAGSTSILPNGYGGTLDVSAGKVIAVAANATVMVPLDKISAFLQGVIAVTNSGTPGDLIYSIISQ